MRCVCVWVWVGGGVGGSMLCDNTRCTITTTNLFRYHRMVLSTLQDRRAVLRSMQFPFRFFSAYKVLAEVRSVKAKPGQAPPSEKRVKECVSPTPHPFRLNASSSAYEQTRCVDLLHVQEL
jgi:hypothetical protein